MEKITHIINNIKRKEQEISEAYEKLCRLKQEKEELTQALQSGCSHPLEYVEKRQTNNHKDLGEAKHFAETCLACGKVLESYSVVRGNRVYGPTDIECENKC